MPLYIGMMIHTETRSKKTVTELHDMGLSVSYDRILQLEDKLATAMCEDFRDKGVVVPAQLWCGVLTAGALDNLDQVQQLRAHFMVRASVLTVALSSLPLLNFKWQDLSHSPLFRTCSPTVMSSPNASCIGRVPHASESADINQKGVVCL